MGASSRRLLMAALAVAAVGSGATLALNQPVNDPVTVDRPAQRLTSVAGDVASIYDLGEIDAAVVSGAAAVADAVGGVATTGRTGSLGVSAVLRNGQWVGGPPDTFLTQVTFAAFPQPTVGWLFGPEVSVAVGPNTVAMNEETAAFIGAIAGDRVEFRLLDDRVVQLEIGAVLPRSVLGSTEIAMTTDAADAVGQTADTRVVIWGFTDRVRFDAAIAAAGLDTRADTRVARSWDSRDPDATLGTLDTKLLLGQPWYRPEPDGSLTMHPTWKAAYLPEHRELINNSIPVYARCHVMVMDDLRRALADVAAAGLGSEIDVANANTYGGCYVPRYSRGSGFLSRHAYGMAFDTNTTANCQGCVPAMNCDVVRIFRRNGFAWGGNFREPDGMHFEWVGERRDHIPYESNYCSNIAFIEPTTSTTSAAVTSTTVPATTSTTGPAAAPTAGSWVPTGSDESTGGPTADQPAVIDEADRELGRDVFVIDAIDDDHGH